MANQQQQEREIKEKLLIESINLGPNYNVIKFVGQGTYGQVFRAFDNKRQKTVAIKKVKLDLDDEDEGIPATTIREVSILKKLNHNNIVPLLEISVNPQNNLMYLVFDFFEQDLTHFIYNLQRNNGRSFIMLYQNIIKQILQGLLYCHSIGVLHRDLKPANILLHHDGTIKLADFGMARAFNYPLIKRKLTAEIITLWYRPPEVLMGEKQYDTSIDMWSVGCIFGELLRRRPFFRGDCQIDQLYQIFKFFGTPDESSWPGVSQLPYHKATFPKFQPQPYNDYDGILFSDAPEAFDLLYKMLTLNPNQRISAIDALQHPFFQTDYSLLNNNAQQKNQINLKQ